MIMRFSFHKGDVQMAFEYAIYMMIGDEFKMMECNSQWKEMSLLINYKEVKVDTQYKLEKLCINYANVLKRRLPKSVWKENVIVKIYDNGSYLPEVRFVGEHYILRIFCKYRGRKSKLDFELLKKTTK